MVLFLYYCPDCHAAWPIPIAMVRQLGLVTISTCPTRFLVAPGNRASGYFEPCMYLQYLGPTYFIENARTCVFLYDFTYEIHEKCTFGSPAVLVTDEIHCNKYPGTRRIMNVGYPGSKKQYSFQP